MENSNQTKVEITAFTRANLALIQKDIDAAMKVISEKYGIDLRLGNTSFTNSTFTSKLSAKTRDLDSLNKMYALDFKILGLPQDCIGKTFTYNNKVFKITGINRKKSKCPVETLCLTDNKVYFVNKNIANLINQK